MNFNEFKEKYRLVLTAAQSEACCAVNGYTLLLAVPGSGKTTVLISRLGYMIYALGIDPRSVLTMTYTVAATHDMRERFCAVFGEDLRESLEFRTINGVCAKIIASYERMKGGRAFTLVTDEKELSAAVSAIYRECTGEFPTESDVKNVRAMITYAKNMMLSAEEAEKLDEEDLPFSKILQKYNAMLREQKLMDYDDQMVYAHKILRMYPAILARISARYRYVCVDEAQDTSKIQHTIISLIAREHGNLFMVGDEDQSIYGFRAAYPEALLLFEAEHEGAKILKIEKNFRSGASIVAAADGFIAKNTLRHQKTMVSARNDAGEVREIALRGKTEQYSYLLKVAKACREETAVLYRNNESALPLIDILEKFNVPYRVKALDTAFFTSRTVQDIANIVRFANNNCDTEAFMQIYYKINTHLSKAAAQAACDYCNREGMNVLDAVWEVGKLGMGTLKSCKAMKSHFMSLLTERADKAVFRIVNYMGYGEYMDRMGINRSKAEILEAIGAGEPTAKSLISRLSALCELAREHRAPEGCRFTLSTIHSAKGLEYDTVYLADVCDGVFPESTVINPKSAPKELLAAYEEERRLFYVGATRAKSSLFLFTYAGKSSSFCDELLGKEKAKGGIEKAISSVPTGHRRTEKEIAEFCGQISVGCELCHRAFGKGTVISIEGDIISVKFESGARKLSARMLLEMNLLI
ncbi:MAG: ATP-dependent helicase [Clostridia bacterium]|nr:ATP-dependent helicase [Clostridia bacterium]